MSALRSERPVWSRACDEGLYENVKTENDPEGRTCPPFGNWIPQTQDLPKSTGSYRTHVLC